MVVCITLLFVLLGFTSFGDTSCEAYKTQVINDCNSLISSLQYTRSRVFDIRSQASGWIGYSNDVYQSSFQSIIAYADNAMGSLDTNISQVNSIKTTALSLTCNSSDGSCDCAEVLGNISTQLSTISDNLVVQGVKIDTINARLNSILSIITTINGKLTSVDRNVLDISTAVADIKDYLISQTDLLQDILGDSYDKGIQGILANAEATTEWLDDIYGLLQLFEEPITDIAAQLYQICDYFDNYLQEAFPLWLELLRKIDPDKVSSMIDNINWFVGRNGESDIQAKSFQDLYLIISLIGSNVTNRFFNIGMLTPYPYYRLSSSQSISSGGASSFWRDTSKMRNYYLKDYLYWIFNDIYMSLSSLNNYHWANYNSMGVLTNLVSSGFSSITNTLVEQFSIFANDSPLKGTTEEPDKYYDYLTNYYIKVSVNPSGSASEPYTNWFNRIEMLLAALVFKTDKAVSNDFTTASAESMEGSLSGALDNVRGIQDNSQSVITSVEKSSQSLLNVMSQWNDKLTMSASLPSHIEFVDLGGAKDGGGAKSSSDSSSGVDTKIGIDLSSGPLKLFVDSCRSITTLCWIFVFIFAGWGVARFMVAKFLIVIKLCYVIFKTALGLG